MANEPTFHRKRDRRAARVIAFTPPPPRPHPLDEAVKGAVLALKDWKLARAERIAATPKVKP